MGKDRRKKDAVKKQTVTPSSNETDSEPKGQREPRVRAQQREVPKNLAAANNKTANITTTAEEETKKSEPINTEELFANLKRETDDIKTLTSKKYAKRQIFSNWEKYEEPSSQPQYEVDIQGADFESLLQGPNSGGGHFQFKSERSWDANVSALSGELFSLDIDLLSEGLATIPLYKKLDIPITFFSGDEIEIMDCLARTALKQYDTAKKKVKKIGDNKKDVKEITNRLLDIIKEPSPAPIDRNSTEARTFLNFDIDQSEIQNEVNETMNEKESYNNSYINDKPEICEKAALRQTQPSGSKASEILAEECPNTVLKSSTEVSKGSFQEIQQNILPSRKIKNETLPTRENNKDIILPEETKNEVASVRESGKEGTLPKENRREKVTVMKDIKKESTSKDISTDLPKQVEQVLTIDSSENVDQEPAIPLGQRTSKRKPKGQSQTLESQNKSEVPVTQSVSQSQNKAQISERQNQAHVSENQKKQQFMEIQNKSQPLEYQITKQVTESKNKVENLESHKKVQISENQVKPQQSKTKPQSKQSKHKQEDDDLDFLLSLKKPVRESQFSGLQPSEVAKPSIEEEDTNISECDLLGSPQKQTEDLEDWLDSMLRD